MESATPTSVIQRRARWSSPARIHISPKTKLRMPPSKYGVTGAGAGKIMTDVKFAAPSARRCLGSQGLSLIGG